MKIIINSIIAKLVYSHMDQWYKANIQPRQNFVVHVYCRKPVPFLLCDEANLHRVRLYISVRCTLKIKISAVLFTAGHRFNSQNFREMIPLLGVFRIMVIVIIGRLFFRFLIFFKLLWAYLFFFILFFFNLNYLTPFSFSSRHRFWICLLQEICPRWGWYEGKVYDFSSWENTKHFQTHNRPG